MEMHQLRYFTALAQTGNFSRAAEQCHVAQPSLSQQIRKLEEELGEQLFTRTGRRSQLTPAGELLRPRAEKILEEIEAARHDLTHAQGVLRGKLAVGALPTIAPYLLPRVLAEYTRLFPAVDVSVQEETTARLLELTLAHQVDCAILSRPIHDDRLVQQLLFSEELLLALPPGHRLARRRRLTPADFDEERLIVMKEGHCLGEQVLGFCAQSHYHPGISCRSAQLETIQAMVRAGLGLSLIPAMAVVRRGGEAPLYRSLPAPRPRREIIVVWPRLRTPRAATLAFLETLGKNRPKERPE